jgi:hypothetical protein
MFCGEMPMPGLWAVDISGFLENEASMGISGS